MQAGECFSRSLQGYRVLSGGDAGSGGVGGRAKIEERRKTSQDSSGVTTVGQPGHGP